MVSNNFILGLIGTYFIITCISIYEKNYSRMMYFIGAIILSIGLLMK